jgi:hypothetical protein
MSDDVIIYRRQWRRRPVDTRVQRLHAGAYADPNARKAVAAMFHAKAALAALGAIRGVPPSIHRPVFAAAWRAVRALEVLAAAFAASVLADPPPQEPHA